MAKNQALLLIEDGLLTRNLGMAITATDNFLAVHPHQIDTDRLFAIKTDYRLMTDYWRRGFKDPQLGELYNTLLKRMYVLYANIANAYSIRHTPLLSTLSYQAHASARDWSPQNIKDALEAFVSEVAMLDLEPAHTAAPKRQDL
jgi:hypothetical protein